MERIGASKVGQSGNEYELLKDVVVDDVVSTNVKIRFLFKRNSSKGGHRHRCNYEGREWILVQASVFYQVENSNEKTGEAKRFNFGGRFVSGSSNSFKPSKFALRIMLEKLRIFIDKNYSPLLEKAKEFSVKMTETNKKISIVKGHFPAATHITSYGRSFEVNVEWGRISVHDDGKITNISVEDKDHAGLAVRDLIQKLSKLDFRKCTFDDDTIRRTRLLRVGGTEKEDET
jgi:hypothetical protein